ncbi:MAG TPA: phage tail protein [Burkholderiales bacterium]|nr:phage tail protein [Burkholderiales bacterium]
MIAILQDVIFEVSNLFVNTFDNLNRVAKTRYATHEIIGQKPKLEFIGFELDEITFEMNLTRQLFGFIDPMWQVNKLREYMHNKKVLNFTMGSTVYGQYVIENVTDKATNIDNHGNIYKVLLTVTMKEYN